MSVKPEPDFTMDELLRELEATLAPAEDGLTSKELANKLGIGVGAVRTRLYKLSAEGKLVRVRKLVRAMDGRMITVVAYKLAKSGDYEA